MSRRRPRAAVLFNAPTLPRDHPEFASESGVVAAARAVISALKSRGFKAFPVAARPPVARLVRSLAKRGPDVVFNLIEGFGGLSGGEARITSLLELMNLPYTGCPPEAQALGRSKSSTKALLIGSGLPTAPFWSVAPGDRLPLAPWPGTVIVKPESEDASLGIDQESVVDSPEKLEAQVERLRVAHGPRVLIESYLPGPEYNVGVLAMPQPEALPPAEVAYQPREGWWPILSYEAKWHIGSEADLVSPVVCPAAIDASLAARLGSLARSAFLACSCRDYARVDFRLDAKGDPMILELNPNPDLDPSAGLARAIAASGRDWGDVIAGLALQAIERGPRRD